MSCSRKSFNNILCDTYINSVGHICNECQQEFKDYLKSECINLATERDIEKQLEIFMETDKGYNEKSRQMDVDDLFRQHTKR